MRRGELAVRNAASTKRPDEPWRASPCAGIRRRSPQPPDSAARVGRAPAFRLVDLHLDIGLCVLGERHAVGPGVAPYSACDGQTLIDDGARERFERDVAIVADVEQRVEGQIEIDYA